MASKTLGARPPARHPPARQPGRPLLPPLGARRFPAPARRPPAAARSPRRPPPAASNESNKCGNVDGQSPDEAFEPAARTMARALSRGSARKRQRSGRARPPPTTRRPQPARPPARGPLTPAPPAKPPPRLRPLPLHGRRRRRHCRAFEPCPSLDLTSREASGPQNQLLRVAPRKRHRLSSDSVPGVDCLVRGGHPRHGF